MRGYKQTQEWYPKWGNYKNPWICNYWNMEDADEICSKVMDELQWMEDNGNDNHDVVVWFDDCVMGADVVWAHPYTNPFLWDMSLSPDFNDYRPYLKRKKYMSYPRTDLIRCDKCGGWFTPWYHGDENSVYTGSSGGRNGRPTKRTRMLRDLICVHMERQYLDRVKMLEDNISLVRKLEKEIKNGYSHQDNGRTS